MAARLVRRLLAVSGLSLIMVGCGDFQGDSDLRSKLEDQIRAARQGATVDLASGLGFEWDRVFVFGPYASEKTVSEAMGFEWSPGQTLIINDDSNLWLFVKRESVVKAAVNVDGAHLRCLVNSRGFSREEARFRLVSGAGEDAGARFLVPLNPRAGRRCRVQQ